MKFDRETWEARMDQSEQELSVALEAVERAFVETLPPVRAGVTLEDLNRRDRRGRWLSFSNVDGRWGLYVPYKEGLVRIAEADLREKIQAARAVGPLYAAVASAAEREIKDTKEAAARLLEFLRTLHEAAL